MDGFDELMEPSKTDTEDAYFYVSFTLPDAYIKTVTSFLWKGCRLEHS